MQFTGLKDKNGKEIYFGDIVEWSTTYLVGDGEMCRAVVAWSKTAQCWFPQINATSEVIGNVYETPELLK